MPSPLAHLSAGYAIYRYHRTNLPVSRRRIWFLPIQLALVAGLSMLPDLDVLLAIAFGDMQRWHNNFTHSLIFGLFFSLFGAGIFFAIYRVRFWLWFIICFLSYEIHVIMDFFTAERGVMLFWPITDARFASPVQLFYGLQWGLGWFSVWHLWTLFTESLFGIVVIWFVLFLENRKKHQNLPKTSRQQEKL